MNIVYFKIISGVKTKLNKFQVTCFTVWSSVASKAPTGVFVFSFVEE
jgi:hypothetical protein